LKEKNSSKNRSIDLKDYHRISLALLLFIIFSLTSCLIKKGTNSYSSSIYRTSEKGDNLKLILQNSNNQTKTNENQISLRISPEKQYQEFIGFGASFTESSAWNLATIPIELRKEVLSKLFSPTDGAGFTLTRTHINSCDYSNSHYSYVEEKDELLSSFSVHEDLKGFSGNENNQVKDIPLVDTKYDLIPMILEASKVPGAEFNIIASPWSPPSWMKTGETAEMTNGSLLPEYYGLWAKYLSKYVSAYKKHGINLWGITPQNEPLHAHDARWDSNGFTPVEGRDFLKNYLGPQFVKDGHLNIENLNEGLRILIYDHNKSTMNAYVKPTYEDPEASKYAWGTAFHWYASSKLEENDWYGKELNELSTRWPNKGMIHTESSIDIDANAPIGQYWRESLDYAGKFVPFDTYAYDIITNLNHGTQGYIEWCMILSHKGQPNPYDNFNSAPILINPITHEIIYTPLYYLLSHFSRFIRPNAVRIDIEGSKIDGLIYTAAKNKDGSVAVIVFNRNRKSYHLNLSLGNDDFEIEIGPRALQTIHLKLKNTTNG